MSKRAGLYEPERGDRLIRVCEIRAEHRDRVFEWRYDDGTGIQGTLADAEHHMLHGTVGIRFTGEATGIFAKPDEHILLKRAGYVVS